VQGAFQRRLVRQAAPLAGGRIDDAAAAGGDVGLQQAAGDLQASSGRLAFSSISSRRGVADIARRVEGVAGADDRHAVDGVGDLVVPGGQHDRAVAWPNRAPRSRPAARSCRARGRDCRR
jgi:hypothetical protein